MKVSSSSKEAFPRSPWGRSRIQRYGRLLAHPLGEETDPEEMLVVEKLSEEHGWVGRKGRDIPLGTRVKILPNHSCVVGNLADRYTLCDGKGEVIGAWRVAARGKVL